MALLVPGQQVGAHKALAAAVYIAREDFLWCVCRLAFYVFNLTEKLTIQLVPLQMLLARVDLVAVLVVAGIPSRRALSTGAFVGEAGL